MDEMAGDSPCRPASIVVASRNGTEKEVAATENGDSRVQKQKKRFGGPDPDKKENLYNEDYGREGQLRVSGSEGSIQHNNIKPASPPLKKAFKKSAPRLGSGGVERKGLRPAGKSIKRLSPT